MACSLCRKTFRNVLMVQKRNQIRLLCTQSSLTNSKIREKRNELYDQERQRQLALVTRVEKIKVEHKGPPEDCTLIMNKNLSTPFNCAMHIQELLMTRSALALVNGKPWDMHRPLMEDCELRFLHFHDEDPRLLNRTFWRSCSFILGHVLETAFKDQYKINLVNFPRPNVRSGSFIYDADLGLTDWNPTSVELSCLSRIAYKLRQKDLRFQRLEVDASVAEKMFEDNPYKSSQIPNIAAKSRDGSKVPLYRMGDHIDISNGPLISSTSLIGRFNVSAVHDMTCPGNGHLKRVQGVALPTQIQMHHWSYEVLVKRSAKFNCVPLQSEIDEKSEKQSDLDYASN